MTKLSTILSNENQQLAKAQQQIGKTKDKDAMECNSSDNQDGSQEQGSP